MLPVILTEAQVDQLFKECAANEGYQLTIDLEAQEVRTPNGEAFKFEVDPFRKHCQLNGLDDIGLTLQDADDIFIQGLRDWGLYDQVWQAGVILLPVQSVGVMGDERTYERAVALRAVTSTDAMTADWAHLPYEFLGKVSNDIINKVKGVNRVTYDISSKPPATIEWE